MDKERAVGSDGVKIGLLPVVFKAFLALEDRALVGHVRGIALLATHHVDNHDAFFAQILAGYLEIVHDLCSSLEAPEREVLGGQHVNLRYGS